MNEDTREEEYSPDQTFVGAIAGDELFGEPLRPYSFSRKIAAQSMGCIAPAVPNLGEHMAGQGAYPGALNDTIIVTWLRTLKDTSELTKEDYLAGVFTPERAIRQPGEATKAAYAWAELKGIQDFASDTGFAAWKEFLQTMFQVDLSAFEIATEKTGEPELETGNPKESSGPRPPEKSSHGSRGKPGTRQRTSGKK